MTLIEIMIVLAIGALLTAGMAAGIGAATNTKLKSAITLVSAAIRTAYSRSGATSKPMRVVFDFGQKRLWLEEGSSTMLTSTKDPSASGGADPATEAEKQALEQAERVLKGPKIPKPMFRAVNPPGLDKQGSEPGRPLEKGIRFAEIYTAHQTAPVREGRAYLYTWSGGQTESAYIQLTKGETADDTNTMTLVVHPLTGRVHVLQGAKTPAVSLSPEEGSEREDRGTF